MINENNVLVFKRYCHSISFSLIFEFKLQGVKPSLATAPSFDRETVFDTECPYESLGPFLNIFGRFLISNKMS